MNPDITLPALIIILAVALAYSVGITIYCNRLRFRIADIVELTAIQGAEGNWNHDPYMLGMYNGLSLAEAIMLNDKYIAKDSPEKWIDSREQLDRDIKTAARLYLDKDINIEELSIMLVEAEARYVEEKNNRNKRTTGSGYSGGGEEDQSKAPRIDVKYPDSTN